MRGFFDKNYRKNLTSKITRLINTKYLMIANPQIRKTYRDPANLGVRYPFVPIERVVTQTHLFALLTLRLPGEIHFHNSAKQIEQHEIFH